MKVEIYLSKFELAHLKAQKHSWVRIRNGTSTDEEWNFYLREITEITS